MFYIDRKSIDTKKEALIFHIMPSLVVFAILLIITMIFVTFVKQSGQNEQRQAVIEKNSEIRDNFTKRMTVYEDILRGGSGVFAASQSVTRDEWKAYVDSFDIPRRYGGIQGIGYVEMIPRYKLQEHINSIRSQGFDNYTIKPDGLREVYSSIVYIEPFEGDNLKVFGYDMYSERTRQIAMDKARDTRMPAVSDLVKLVQDEHSNNPLSGFLIYLPLYDGSSSTIDERRQNIYGYVYAPFKTKDLIENIYRDNDTNYAFKIFKQTINNDMQLIYETPNANIISKNRSALSVEQTTDLLGERWFFYGYALPNIVETGPLGKPNIIATVGIIMSILVSFIMYLLLINRSIALRKKDEQTIQEAKDELLALASHQLRTPATGVKQYIGMLKDGMGGKLTKLQKSLVDKAYESNERQLDTINEMLFVARADAGELNISIKKIDITRLVNGVTVDMRQMIAKNMQTMQINLPDKQLIINGDQQYLRMAIENIISNASKYTKPGGHISVCLIEMGEKSVQLSVKDNGVGINKSDLRLLFKKFSRIPNELTGKVVGSGIGLYLVRKIIDAHHGEIIVDSIEDVGTTINIILPKA